MAGTVRKISVAIGKAELAWAEHQARAEKTSVSQVLTEAARLARRQQEERARRDEAWSAYVDWATDGAGLSEGELEAGRRELDRE